MSPASGNSLVERVLRLRGWQAWAAAAGLTVVSIIGVWAATGAAAPPADGGEALPGAETLSGLSLAASVFIKLGIVLALIYGSLHLLRRLQIRRPLGSAARLSVLESTHLSPRQALHLVRAGEQVLLVGATDQGIHLIAEIEMDLDPAAQEAPLALSQAAPAADFGQAFFARMFAPRQPGTPAGQPAAPAAGLPASQEL